MIGTTIRNGGRSAPVHLPRMQYGRCMARGNPRYPAGRPPHDPVNGLRVGGLIGGVTGGTLTLLVGATHPWLILVGGVIGAAGGWATEKHKQTSG